MTDLGDLKNSLMKLESAIAERVIEAQADRIAALEAEVARLREALGWFLNDARFVVQVGGNPNVVEIMIYHARAALGDGQ